MHACMRARRAIRRRARDAQRPLAELQAAASKRNDSWLLVVATAVVADVGTRDLQTCLRTAGECLRKKNGRA